MKTTKTEPTVTTINACAALRTETMTEKIIARKKATPTTKGT
jgi:hypothetical protein